MEIEETDNKDVTNCVESYSAVNSLILNYYKKFGKKRDLEQFFSLSTAQSEIRDPSSLFWRRMKSQDESSDSGGKKSESSTELCSISIKCSIPEARPSSQGNQTRVKSDSESPPIISEDVITEPTRNSEDESVKSDDLGSQKSVDGTLDTSTNKPHSPTSSINSQRKLEWDSLADVGYANESDRKNSASSLSTLERMALQQQYSNETKNSDLGQPTAQSTPLDVNENKSKFKKSVIKKTTKIYNKDINSLELSVPPIFNVNPQAINLNLTKHISFNVDRNGSVVVENMSKNVSLSPEKVSVETEVTPQIKIDKEIQTTLNKDKSGSPNEKLTSAPRVKSYPVLINLNTLKKKTRKKKVRRTHKLQSKKKIISDKENLPIEKCGDNLSEAESFEYMPGNIYNENRMKNNQQQNNVSGNKSSLESSGITTDSSNTKRSLTKDLERSINILKSTFDGKYDDVNLRKQLVKEIVQKIVDSKYNGEKSSTEFLSGLSFDSKKLELKDPSYSTTTTSTSDVNTFARKAINSKPKKSILRMDKFATSALASTSQSVPNIPIFTNNETCDSSKNFKSKYVSNTDSDYSTKTKKLSDTAVNKASSEELYEKYLEALKREQAHKKHLKEKEIFLKQKLGKSDGNFNFVRQVDPETQNRIKHLMKDLVRNNYDDGSGDASKLEGGSSSNLNIEQYNSIRKQQSHSVFTLSSGNSDNYYKTETVSNKCQNKAGGSGFNKTMKHYCCCPFHSSYPKVGVTDSSVQVSMEYSRNLKASDCKVKSKVHQHANMSEMEPAKYESRQNKQEIISECAVDNIKYVCLCTEEDVVPEEIPENLLIYKCSRLPTKGIKLGGIASKVTNTPSDCSSKSSFKSQDCEKKCLIIKGSTSSNNLTSKSSQTNLISPIILKDLKSQQNLPSSLSEIKIDSETDIFEKQSIKSNTYVHEATRCIQTEISIDPKKSDPSLSDINIVNDSNCVKLINEQYKKVSQPILEANKKTKSNIDELEQRSNSLSDNKKIETECTLASVEDRFTSTNNAKKIDKGVQFNHITNNISNRSINQDQSPNNFSIPIQGTNMTLKVTLGSDINELHGDDKFESNKKNNATIASKGTDTVKYSGVETFTSLQEECSKEAQCSDTNFLGMLDQKLSSVNCPIQTAVDTFNVVSNKNEKTNSASKSCNVNTCMTTGLKLNTFPTENQKHDQKPLLRSNTDPSKIEKASNVKLNHQTLKGLDDQTVDTSSHQTKYSEIPKNEKVVSGSKISKSLEITAKNKEVSDPDEQSQSKTSCSESDSDPKLRSSEDPLLDVIQDITKRFSKKNIEKSKRKKCFKEIISVLNYLLDTEESTDNDHKTVSCPLNRNNTCEVGNLPEKETPDDIPPKILVDKGIQLSTKKSKSHKTESSDLPISTDMPNTSSDSATCKVLNKIKRECEKYHQKRCKLHTGAKKCEVSSSTSVNCDQCRRVHHCTCRGHRCRNHRTKTTVEKTKKKSVAYNLIIQTSDSIVSEEINYGINRRPLQNIIVKVPSKRNVEKLPFKEVAEKIERDMPQSSPRCNYRVHRSKSLPKESGISSNDEFLKKAQAYTVREYLDKNRPDFVEKCSDRQQCLKVINESRTRDRDTPRLNMIVVHPPTCNGNSCMETCSMYCGGVPMNNCIACPYSCIQNDVIRIASERAAKQQLLSLQLDRQQALNTLSESDLKDLARELGNELRRKKVAPKFINEREMKKHSEKIYKSLPEVVNKKEEIKRENLKKTNLLMANIFKKNLQKKTLHGTVNISNYSTVIKI